MTSPSASPYSLTAVPEIAHLQQLAEDACLCEEAGGVDCRKAYQQAAAGRISEDSATACAPISTVMDTITLDGKEYSVTTEYNVVANLPAGMSHRLCRRADAQAVEQAWIDAFGPVPDWNKPVDEKALKAKNDAADRAVVEVLKALAKGERRIVRSRSGGCA